jgi:murein L,D-transpeptidase YcbB/YkuD
MAKTDRADVEQRAGSPQALPQGLSRRGVLGRVGLASLAWTASTRASAAQCNWFESILTPGCNSAKAAPSERKLPEPLNDLRPDATPWRSEAMIEAFERAIQRYQQIADNGGWPTVPGTRMIRPEDDDERLPVLRRRLAASGELARLGTGSNSFAFDAETEAAVRRYQENNGLRVSGRVDKPTLASLNVSAHVRVQQLKVNLQRVRELMQQRPEDRYVLVNAAAFQLEAVERGEVQQRHRVIAGRTERQSPVVKATIKAINFFPYWRVPDSVATLDIIPRLQKEPDYLTKEKIRVVRGTFNGPEVDPANIDWRTATSAEFKFRQDPGPHNALGLMRIDMPNSEGVYMHDTPMKQLFQQRGRAFSAGCVRVQDVPKLVDWIARYETGWDQPGRADAVVETGNALDLNLTRPIPVYFTYITAWAEPRDGRVVFRPDIYGRDGLRDATAGRERDESEGPPPPPSLAP